jgi:hypothetical protein
MYKETDMKRFTTVLLAAIVLFAFATPVLAMGAAQEIDGVTLDAAQVILVGLIASALTTAFRLIYEFASKQNFTVPDWVMQLIVGGVSFGVAWLWFPPVLPDLPAFGADFAENAVIATNYLSSLFVALAAEFVVAHIFYKWFVERIQHGLEGRLGIR